MRLVAAAAAAFAAAFAAALLCGGGAVGAAQQIDFGGIQAKPATVRLISDAAMVTAGKPDMIELRFRVEPGLHINSHTPKDEFLLPTRTTFSTSPKVRVLGEEFPAGVPLRLKTGAGEMLSVYEGEFRVRVRVQAKVGQSTLDGALHYQACDAASCFPPRTLPIHIAITAQ